MVCGSTKIKPMSPRVRMCVTCGQFNLRHRLRRRYDKNYHVFSDRGPLYNFLSDFVTLIRVLLFSVKYKNKEAKILEIGCGEGRFLFFLKLFNYTNTVGLEVSRHASKKANKKGLKIINTSFENSKLTANQFDVVIMNHVIEHFVSLPVIMRKLQKITKNGGLVIVTTPNGGGFPAKIFGENWYDWDFSYHMGIFTKKSLLKLFKLYGFEAQTIRYGILPNDISRSLAKLINLNRRLVFLLDLFFFPTSLLLSIIGVAGRFTATFVRNK